MLLFTASWCEPCQELKEWINQHIPEDVSHFIEIVDIDKSPVAAGSNHIKGIPTLIVGNRRYEGREEIKPYLTHLGELGG